MVVHAADIPTTDKEKRSKSDTVDCRKLSQRLSEGSLKPIHIPCLRQQNDRHLLRTYKQFIKDQTVLKNRIKCWLFFQGIAIPEELQSAEGHWTQKFIFYLKALPVTDPTAKASLELLLKGLDNVRQQVLEATRQLRALANQEHMKGQVELLRSVPGIGQLTALLLLTEIGDVNRFATFDRLSSFVGLVPTMH
jgi:transposase